MYRSIGVFNRKLQAPKGCDVDAGKLIARVLYNMHRRSVKDNMLITFSECIVTQEFDIRIYERE